MKKQSGFTLIELVVVIVILGILSAVALPRFANMQKDARTAKLRAVEGAMQGAAAMAHGLAQARAGQGTIEGCSVDNAGTGTVAMGGKCVQVAHFYPTDALDGIVLASLTMGTAASSGVATLAELNAQGYSYNGTHGIMVIGGTGTSVVTGSGGAPDHSINATCAVPYTAPTGAGTAPTIGPVAVAGC